MAVPPRRRWYQFSLRTMFVVVAAAAVPLAWVGYSMNWIRQRQQFILKESIPGYVDPRDLLNEKSAPAGLWMFGEVGRYGIVVKSKDYNRARSLFPEATLSTDD